MNCSKCGCWEPVCRCDREVFYTSKDKLWEFETSHLGKRIQIRDKAQWKRYMKQYGLHDDVPKKPESKEKKYKPVPREETAKLMMERLQKNGTYHKLVPELRQAMKRR